MVVYIYYTTAAGNHISSQLGSACPRKTVRNGTVRYGPPCWVSPLAFGLVGWAHCTVTCRKLNETFKNYLFNEASGDVNNVFGGRQSLWGNKWEDSTIFVSSLLALPPHPHHHSLRQPTQPTLVPETHMKRSGTTACPACWAVGTNEMKLFMMVSKNILYWAD
jgi:hypothetical protein